MKVSDIVVAALPALAVATDVWSKQPNPERAAKFSTLEYYLGHVLQVDDSYTSDSSLALALDREFKGKWNNLLVTVDDFDGLDLSQLIGDRKEEVDDREVEKILGSSSWEPLTLGLKALTSKYHLKFDAFENRIHTIWNYARSSPKVMWSNENDYEWVETMPTVVEELAHLLTLNDVVVRTGANSSPKQGESFVFHSQALRLAAEKYGKDSEQFKQLKSDLESLFERLSTIFNVYVVAVEPKHSSDEITKRNEQLESLFARAEDTSCFSSEEACQVSTSNCNNHGVCTKTKGCWACLCSPTIDKKKGTTSWSGFDCSKRDVSFQANLFLWTGVAAVVVIAGGVSFLFSLGSEPLPGVLEAMTKKST